MLMLVSYSLQIVSNIFPTEIELRNRVRKKEKKRKSSNRFRLEKLHQSREKKNGRLIMVAKEVTANPASRILTKHFTI